MAILIKKKRNVNKNILVVNPAVDLRPPISNSIVNIVAQAITRPALNVWITDSSFLANDGANRELMRLTGPDDVRGVRSDYSKGYSTFWNWSKNDTYFKAGQSMIFNGQTFDYIKTLSLPASARSHFSNLDDNKMYVFGDNKVQSINITTNVLTLIFTFTAGDGWDRIGTDGSVSTNNEGTIDQNDKFVMFNMFKTGVSYRVLFDLQLGVIVAMRTDVQLEEVGDNFDSVKVTKSGLYILINRLGVGKVLYLRADWATATGTSFITNLGSSSHADPAFDTTGREVIIAMDTPGYYDILTGVKTDPIPSSEINTAFGTGNAGGHADGQCPSGEGVFSFHTIGGNNPYIVSVDLHPTSRRVRKWVHARRVTGSMEAVANMNRAGTVLAFNTNFGDSGDSVTVVCRRKI